MNQVIKTLSWLRSIKVYSAFKQIMITFMLLNMKENVKLRRVDKEGVYTYISIKDSHTNIYMEKIYIEYFLPLWSSSSTDDNCFLYIVECGFYCG